MLIDPREAIFTSREFDFLLKATYLDEVESAINAPFPLKEFFR